ncbi:MAG: GAF domain-containing protein [Ardenticatenia bacterium]|nr:GAF domain-containing protein [Ardenticatenia bacterium]
MAELTVHDMLWVVRQRDTRQILETLLVHLVELTGSQGGGLLFASPHTPIILRHGRLPPKAMTTLSGWDHAMLNHLRHGPLHVEIASQVALDDHHVLLKLPMNTPDAVVGYIGLLYTATQVPKLVELEDVRTFIQATANFVALLDELTSTRRRLDRLALLYEVGQALASTLDLSALLYETIKLAVDVINAEGGSLMLYNESTDELIFKIVYGPHGQDLEQARIPADKGIAGWVFQHGEPVISNTPQADPRFSHEVDLQTGFRTRSILCVPMQIKGRIIGVLEVVNKQTPGGFDEEDKELLLTLAGQAAIALENARLYESLREERDKILQVQEEVRRGDCPQPARWDRPASGLNCHELKPPAASHRAGP